MRMGVVKVTKKKFAILCILALTFSIALFCGCSDSRTNPYDRLPDYGFSIENLDVVIDASEGDRSMRITEVYTFEFNEFSRGFYRDFALNSGEKIRDLKVSDADDFSNEYKVTYEGSDILRLRVGSEYRFANTISTCTISYTMITPPHADYEDALVVNAIGAGWSCRIRQASVRVKLPEETIAPPRYYYGEWGASNNAVGKIVSGTPQSGQSEYEFTVRPQGKDSYALNSYEGLTLYYFMPKGAFGTYIDWQLIVIIAAAVILVGIIIALKFTVGANAPLTPVTQYYPPKHANAGERDVPMDPLDIGYLIDNTCQSSDVTSLIFYFASLGYIRIIDPNKGSKTSGSFKLVKVCDLPDGLPDYQYTFFDKLFSRGDKVSVSQLTNRMYSTVENVRNKVRTKYANKLYSPSVRALSIGVSILTVLFAFLTVFLAGLRINTHLYNFFGAIAVIPVIISALLGQYLVYNWLKLGKTKRIALFAFMCVFAAVASLLLIAVTHRDSLGYAEIAVIIVAVVTSGIIAPFIAKRTEYYNSELNYVLGFKDFLATAEKDKLETLLEENPQYYYDILPYANVLGVSDIWENKFRGLTLEPPQYYRGGRMFSFILFSRCYRNSYTAYSSANISRPSSSSHSGGGRSGGFGGGGGGGFSGGGFGGGGGGRW